MGKTKHFEVPIVLQNLPPAETLNQMMDSLNFLNKVVDEAFASISAQVKEERDHIQKLRDRVSTAQAKVDLISKQPNRATTVYSAQKYPGKASKVQDEPLVDMTQDQVRPVRPKYRLPLEERGKRTRPVDTLSLFQRLGEKTSRKYEETPVGVGRLPSHLTSVADCLLFNTDVNPYVKYSLRDGLEGTEMKDREKVIKGIGQQPQSIQDRNLVLDVDDVDLNFQPTQHAAPAFAMPTNIPGLQDLALNEAWTNHVNMQTQGFTSLAPSANNFAALPDINEVPDFESILDNVPIPENVPMPPDADASKAPLPPDMDDAAKAPMPPPEEIEEKMPAVPTKAAAPPSEKKSKPSGGGGGRAALLDAIRLGSKLKKASKRKPSAKKPPPMPKKLSLMDHLKEKLKRRNDLMSGKLDASGKEAGAGGGATDAGAPGKSVTFSLPPKEEEPEKDETGFGIKNIPASMRKSMLIVDEHDDEDEDNADWD